jgi:hypothetical protein
MALISNHQGDLSPLKTQYVLPGEADFMQTKTYIDFLELWGGDELSCPIMSTSLFFWYK